MREQGGELLDPICMQLFQCLRDLTMQLGALFKQDRFVGRFLNEDVAKGILFQKRFDQADVFQILNLRVELTAQTC